MGGQPSKSKRDTRFENLIQNTIKTTFDTVIDTRTTVSNDLQNESSQEMKLEFSGKCNFKGNTVSQDATSVVNIINQINNEVKTEIVNQIINNIQSQMQQVQEERNNEVTDTMKALIDSLSLKPKEEETSQTMINKIASDISTNINVAVKTENVVTNVSKAAARQAINLTCSDEAIVEGNQFTQSILHELVLKNMLSSATQVINKAITDNTTKTKGGQTVKKTDTLAESISNLSKTPMILGGIIIGVIALIVVIIIILFLALR